MTKQQMKDDMIAAMRAEVRRLKATGMGPLEAQWKAPIIVKAWFRAKKTKEVTQAIYAEMMRICGKNPLMPVSDCQREAEKTVMEGEAMKKQVTLGYIDDAKQIMRKNPDLTIDDALNEVMRRCSDAR